MAASFYYKGVPSLLQEAVRLHGSRGLARQTSSEVFPINRDLFAVTVSQLDQFGRWSSTS
jgi:hypothetical protein